MKKFLTNFKTSYKSKLSHKAKTKKKVIATLVGLSLSKIIFLRK